MDRNIFFIINHLNNFISIFLFILYIIGLSYRGANPKGTHYDIINIVLNIKFVDNNLIMKMSRGGLWTWSMLLIVYDEVYGQIGRAHV